MVLEVPQGEIDELRRRIEVRRAVEPGNSSPGRRWCNWRRYRTSRATGRPSMTGAGLRGVRIFCRSLRPRSTGWTSTSSPLPGVSDGRFSVDHDARLAGLRRRTARRLSGPTSRADRAALRTRFHLGAAVDPPATGSPTIAGRAGWGPIVIRTGVGGANAAPGLYPVYDRAAVEWAPRSPTRWAAWHVDGLIGTPPTTCSRRRLRAMPRP